MATEATVTRQTDTSNITMIPVDLIVPPEINRDDYGEKSGALAELADDIRQQGLLQPVTVAEREDGKYDLIMGERRLRAVKRLGLGSIEAKVVTLNPVERMLAQLSENLHRLELNPLERARQLQKLFDVAAKEGQPLTQETAAKRLGLGSQAQVSKHLALWRLYTSVPAFKSAWDKGTLRFTDAVELGRLSRTPKKDAEEITRIMGLGLKKGNMAQAVKREIEQRQQAAKRETKIRELETAGATIASDDCWKNGARRIGPKADEVNLDVQQHATQACHAVYVTGALEVQPICLKPEQHPQPPQQAASDTHAPKPTATSPTTSTRTPAASGATRADVPRASDASNGQQAPTTKRDTAETKRAEALQAADTARRGTLRAWLDGSRKMSRPLSDAFVFGQVIEAALQASAINQGIVRDLLSLPDDQSDVTDAVHQLASQNGEQLRRVAVALVCASVEAAIERDRDYRNGSIEGHYRLLAELGYEPSDEEQEERNHTDTKAVAA